METKPPSTKKELVAVLVRKDQLSQEIHIKPKWQSSSFLTIASFEERGCVQMGTRTPEGF